MAAIMMLLSIPRTLTKTETLPQNTNTQVSLSLAHNRLGHFIDPLKVLVFPSYSSHGREGVRQLGIGRVIHGENAGGNL